MKLDKLKKRYGITGGTYQDLISKILQENAKVIHKHVVSVNDDHYKKVATRFNKKSAKRFVVPDIFDEIPDSGLQLRKSAEKGQLISDTLKDDLRNNLREVLDLKTGVTGQSKLITQTNKKAGTINNHLIDLYEKKITETFANYIKDDPNAKMPSNIKTIATTEVRSAVHDVQHSYVTELTKRNPTLRIFKKWIHNPNLSIVQPRDNHAKLGRLKAIPLEQNYIFQTDKGKTVSASRPHDPSLPPEEVIGCHCDIEYQGVYIMSDDKLQQVRKSLQNMVEKTYEIGKIVDRKDGKWKKTGQGQWEKVKEENQDSGKDDDKELDAMLDEKGKMSEEMNKETIDQQAEAISQLIDEGILTQEEFNSMSVEDINQLLNDEGFINEGDPEADERQNQINDLVEQGYTEAEAKAEVDGVEYNPEDDPADEFDKAFDNEVDSGNEIDDMLGELSDYGVDINGLDNDDAIKESYIMMVEDNAQEKLQPWLGDDYVAHDSPHLAMSKSEVNNLLEENGGKGEIINSIADDMELSSEDLNQLKNMSDHEIAELGSALGYISDSSMMPEDKEDSNTIGDGHDEDQSSDNWEHGLTEDEALESLQAEGFSDEEISGSGLSAQQMLHEYYTDTDIYNDTAMVQLKEEGFTDKQIKDSGLSPKELLAEYQKDMNPKGKKK